MASRYKSTQHHGQHVLRAHGIMASMYKGPQDHASMYKSPQCHAQNVQDCTASVWLKNSSAFNLCKAVLIQILNATHLITVTVRTSPSTVRNFHSIQNNHLLHTDINRHGEAHSCSTTLSNACKTLTLSISCYSFVGFQL